MILFLNIRIFIVHKIQISLTANRLNFQFLVVRLSERDILKKKSPEKCQNLGIELIIFIV